MTITAAPYSGTHDAVPDPRNAEVLIYVNGALKPRAVATVSVFDSGFLVGDGVWEGVRLRDGVLLLLDAHLERLYEGAKAIDLDNGLIREALIEELTRTVRANDIWDGVHVRLMVTRGTKHAVARHFASRSSSRAARPAAREPSLRMKLVRPPHLEAPQQVLDVLRLFYHNVQMLVSWFWRAFRGVGVLSVSKPAQRSGWTGCGAGSSD